MHRIARGGIAVLLGAATMAPVLGLPWAVAPARAGDRVVVRDVRERVLRDVRRAIERELDRDLGRDVGRDLGRSIGREVRDLLRAVRDDGRRIVIRDVRRHRTGTVIVLRDERDELRRSVERLRREIRELERRLEEIGGH